MQTQVALNGRVAVLVHVNLRDTKGAEVARLEVEWVIIGRRREAAASSGGK